ncbi:hypothetical protein AAVH_12747 [Aphelenchoides avenae]|nr:hypothetical protein AAVH_12747 [Aphelenchus avenae]
MDVHKPYSCNTYHRCPWCEVNYPYEAGKKNGGHRCGDIYCRQCCKRHRGDVGCFIRPLQAKKSGPHRIVAYDVEAIIQKSRRPLAPRKDEVTASETFAAEQTHTAAPFLVDDDGNDIAMEESDDEEEAPRNPFVSSEEEFGVSDDPNRTDHEVNYKASIVMCSECIDDWTWADYENENCKVCGPQKVFKCGEWEVPEGRDVVDEFLDFLLYELPAGYPTVTSAGHKYFQISVKQSKHNNAVSFRDSCLLFPMKLEEAPDAYDLPVKPKGDFAYLFNMRENYGNPVDGLPPAEDYILSRFTNTDELNAFLERHEAEDKKRREEGKPFVLEDVLEEYCFNDVEILAHAILQFREIFNEQARCDLFVECTTITSGCIQLWRRKYLKDNTVAIVPNNGYGRHDRQSDVALKYLKWFEWAHGVNMQYCNGDFGKKEVHTKMGRKKLDGYIGPKAWDSPGFKRCNVAACPYCEKLPEEQWPSNSTGKMSSEQLEISQNRIDAIKREGYNVIEPRDGFYGGRVGPMRLYYKPGPDEEIKFFDIVSLYPHVLRNLFPVGHPEVLRYFQERAWDAEMWGNTYKDKYKDVFKVLVLPPKDLTIPVLPMRDNNRLLFPLCRTCAMDSRKMSPFREPSCQHMEMERAFVTTTTHVELDLAFEAGYKVLRVIEVWNYKKWDNTVFAGYINDFMRLKEEATGWEDIAKIEDPVERDRAMDKFIDDYFENTKRHGKDGVRLRKDRVEENKALRSVMKLFLNSLWGRLAMRPDKSHTEFIRSPAKLYKLLDSTSKIVKNIIQIDKDTVRVEWCYVDRFEPEDENSNVVYAMFTTSYGRAELYKHMCAVEESAGGAKGSKFLYGDTDSMAYVRKKGNEPIKSGRYLGDMNNEYPKHTIEEFICGGNKQYGLLLRDNKTGELTTKQKIRGITLNSVTSEMLRYEKMKEMILNPRGGDHYAKVFTLAMEKIYRPIYMKGWIDSNLEIWPHGYVKPEHRGVDAEEQMTESEYYMTLVL